MDPAFLEPWMLEENPEFAKAANGFYSIREWTPKKKGVPVLVLKWQAGERYKAEGGSSDLVLSVTEQFREQNGKALAEGDALYFEKIAKALRFLKSNAGKTYLENVELVLQAYRFLRQRSGKGSPLPTKAEVRECAVTIRACVQLKLSERIPSLLWRNGVSDEDRKRIEVRKDSIFWALKNSWTDIFKGAGLSVLKGEGGRPKGHKNRI
jgi:hypothetical protein